MEVDQATPTNGSPTASRASPSLAAVQEEAPINEPTMAAAESIVSDDSPEVGMDMHDGTPEASAAATLASVANFLSQGPLAASSTAAGATASPVPAIPNPLPPGYNKDQPICANCSTQTTPLWRRSHDSTHILCNACALFFKMKGRPRPISLKTDVIKSRNRSKGKSSSKDRGSSVGAGPSGGSGSTNGTGGHPKKDRGESTSRVRGEEGSKNARKSGPGGSEMEEDELDDAYAARDAKARRVGGGPPSYPPSAAGAWSNAPYPYPHPPHPHQHQPYPPPRSRSRSTSSTRRAPSLEGRSANGVPGYGYPPPPPGYMVPEGYPYYYSPQGTPYYSPSFYPPGSHPPPPPPHAAHALAHPPSTITHAQSDSRSEDTGRESSASVSPPLPSASTIGTTASGPNPAFPQYYPHPNPNYPVHPGYSHSPLNPASAAPSSSSNKVASTVDQPNGRVTLAPMVHFGGTAANQNGGSSRGSTPDAGGEKVHLPPIGSVAGKAPPTGVVPARHSLLFAARPGSGHEVPQLPGGAVGSTATSANTSSARLSPNDRIRRASVSSNSNSVSGSSDGVRSPESTVRPTLPWGPPNWVSAAEDERRGRPEKRFDEMDNGIGKGKDRADEEEIDELLDDDEDGTPDDDRRNRHQNHMVGVEAGLGELRVVDQFHQTSHSYPGSISKTSSRSRSSGAASSTGGGRDDQRGRGERGRMSVTPFRGRSQSTSRARGDSSVRSTSRPSALAVAEAEIARLKLKVSELTFLNNLMQSRLGQLEGPGRVPSQALSGLVAPTPAPERMADPDDDMDDEMDEGIEPTEEDEELEGYGVTAKDPATRANLLSFFRAQQQGVGAAV